MSDEFIKVRGARVHNLKNLDCDIPLNSLTVISGPSGSGKSSLAFDTLYGEGQRRYVESLSAYARQFLERIEKPEVDSIDGIAPAIAIRQKNATRNPRSTVATATEIYDYLRLLFARVGRTVCPDCKTFVNRDSVDQVVTRLLASAAGQRAYVLFPVKAAEHSHPLNEGVGADGYVDLRKSRVPAEKKRQRAASDGRSAVGDRDRLFDLRQKGFNRLFQDGKIVEFSTPESLLDLDFTRPVFVLADRLSIDADARSRIVDAVETAYRESGEVIFEFAGDGAPPPLRFNERFQCKTCGRLFEEPQPRLFSFNNPYGACPRCQGFGNTIDFDRDLVIPDPNLTLGEGAIDPWTKPRYRQLAAEMKRFARQARIAIDVPWNELPQEQRDLIINGEGRFPGVRGFFAYLERKKYKLHVRVFLSRYRGYALCPECVGRRLRQQALWIQLCGPANGQPDGARYTICDVCEMTVTQARDCFQRLSLSAEEAGIAEMILLEIRQRLDFLVRVGLGYLTLDRLASTLSGGEAQRIQLATCLGSHLVGSLYVLDEPSIGLHSRDTNRLIGILKSLRDLGNTIVVVEHDADVINSADWVLDLGPAAGEKGGQLMASGSVEQIKANVASLTGKYLSGQLKVPVPVRKVPGRHWLQISKAHAHNLKQIDVDLPLNLMVAITGVSGSGKSTLVHDVLYKCVLSRLANERCVLEGCADVRGTSQLQEVILVDQSPIGRTPRSNPVTYIKAFDAVRAIFADTPEARKRGYGAGDFSFNVPGGRCEACQGDGVVTVEMQFLADVQLVCEECKGTRYKAGVLEVTFRGKNIHEVLQMTVREAIGFFAGHMNLVRRLKLLDEVGLGYVRLGQSATTLSGGEAQRIKLAAHLAQSSAGARTLYLFDEPTTGLHFDDIAKLLYAFRRLIDSGGSVVVIEHNLDVIRAADWVIDLGPEGGEEGGRIVVAGTPDEVAACPQSYTGRYLARMPGTGPAVDNATETEPSTAPHIVNELCAS